MIRSSVILFLSLITIAYGMIVLRDSRSVEGELEKITIPLLDSFADLSREINVNYSSLLSFITEYWNFDWETYKKEEMDFSCDYTSGTVDKEEIFQPLIERLLAEGYSRELLNQYFSHAEVKFIPEYLKVVTNLSHPRTLYPYLTNANCYSTGINYQLRPLSFYQRYETLLKNLSNRYNVPAELIVAICWIETKCGYFTGHNLLFNVFANLALFTIEDNLNIVLSRAWDVLPYDMYLTFEEKARARANWGYDELKNLIVMSRSTHYDIMKIKGSYAGAFGIGQFLPSSYIRFAVDGNADGKRDLFQIYDALSSVANYLKRHGARKEDEQSQKSAILAYNRDGHYLRAVWGIATLIRKHIGEEEEDELEYDELFARYDYYGDRRGSFSLLHNNRPRVAYAEEGEENNRRDYYSSSYEDEEVDADQIREVQNILLNPRSRQSLYQERYRNSMDGSRSRRLGDLLESNNNNSSTQSSNNSGSFSLLGR